MKSLARQNALSILEDRARVDKIQAELAASDIKHAQWLATNPMPGIKPRALGAVAAQ